ncbi:hypothetical protein MHH28_02020 [Paenibacillus sp. FSL K6-1217]|uniref:hypothetical protein n=1 Tax=Paenibacillus sp. FSL K6-1217 TaxID=2921466 RepID=UPI00324A4145
MKSNFGAIDNAFMYETIISYRLSSNNDRSSPIIDLLSGERNADETDKFIGGASEKSRRPWTKREFMGGGKRNAGDEAGNGRKIKGDDGPNEVHNCT